MSQERLKKLLYHNATDPNRVTDQVVDLQLATAEALRTRLDAYGGVILGDEVGAGKTFVAFATLADRLLSQPGRGAAVFVPSGPLVHKWSQQMRDYLRAAVRDPEAGSALAGRVVQMDRSLRVQDEKGAERRPRRGDIVVTQHSVFSRQTSDSDRAVCLERWIALRCKRTRKPWSRLFAACDLERWQANEDRARWAGTDVLSSQVLRPIDVVFARWEAGDRALRDPLRQAVQEVRRAVGRKVLPDAALIIVDEAHNLRSASSQIYRSLMEVLHDRFDAMLFLTATPFQLGRDELRTIVEFFRSARGAAARSGDFDRRVVAMQAGMDGYVDALEAFGRAWRDLEASEVVAAERVCAAGEEAPEPSAPARIQAVGQRFRECLAAKERLERGLQPFLVRSIRWHHHREACGVDQIPAASRIPVALVDRLIAERLAGRRRVFVASALTSACSSWNALFGASITSGSDEREHSLRALSAMREEDLLGPHPKTQSTIESCLAAVRAQEKTLVFVERTETGRAIRDELVRALDRQRDQAAYRRLQSPERFGWPSLRENYLHSLYPEVFGAPPSPELCLRALEHPDIVELWRSVDREGEPRNYKVEKRLLEHATFRDAERRDRDWRSRVGSEPVKRCVENILEPLYVLNGLDLRSGRGEDSLPIPDHPVRAEPRPPNPRFAAAYAGYPSPWFSCRRWLRQLDPEARADVVDAAAAAIATSHLQIEVDRLQAADDPATYFPQVHGLLASDATGWPARFEAIAEQAADLAAGDPGHQEDLGRLADALRSNKRIQFVDGGTPSDTKQQAIDGFNTPLYPEVLIATGVLAEGIDLHRSCRRVIHHDLPWNPAKLEQRTGRIDRIGSLASRLQARLGADADGAAIEVGLPYVAGTYDETIFRRVLARRREFRCLLGSRPEWESETPDVEESSAMSEAIVEALQVKLDPEADGERPRPRASGAA